jgi:phosphoglucosamine mutase
MLREHAGTLGGEASGHLICLDKATTGDGMISALAVLGQLKRSDKSLAQVASEMPKFPQLLINVSVSQKCDVNAHPGIQQARQEIEQRLAGRGRIVLRASGTEPLIRVMVEGEEMSEVENAARELASRVQSLAGSR